MGFKSDREFLRNVTVGAVGTRQVATLLRQAGCQIIELERYSQSNKIWATKIKRLRVADLLCIRCGVRIESRAKSDLKLRMSHALNNPDRAWDRGLRDNDLVAFIRCAVSEDIRWQASDELALFRVRDLRATQHLAAVSQMKSASEGNEVYLTWPATVPTAAGTVASVSPETLKVRFDTGRSQSYRMLREIGAKSVTLQAHVKAGETFGAGSRIIASVLPEVVPAHCTAKKQYDFLPELAGAEHESVYCAAKALGFLPALRGRSVAPLQKIAANHADARIRLEAAAALARLNCNDGWSLIEKAVREATEGAERMESVLILSELGGSVSAGLLTSIAGDSSNPSELRAASAWGLPESRVSLRDTGLVDLIADSDEMTALHAIVAASRIINDESIELVLEALKGDPRTAAAGVRVLQLSNVDAVPEVVRRLRSASGDERSWLVYLLCVLGRSRCEEFLAEHAPTVLPEVQFFWRFHAENWTSRTDVSDQTEFLRQQVLE